MYKLAICIPTLNRADLLDGLLRNLHGELTLYDNSTLVQVVVVDGGSNDATFDVVEKYKDKLIIKFLKREMRFGIDQDILKCVELADSEYCWLFSDDDRFQNGSIDHILKILKAHDGLSGCFCNRTSYDSELTFPVAEIKNWPSQLILNNKVYDNKAEIFEEIGMDLGFISSQIIHRAQWQKVVEAGVANEFFGTCYLMVHVIASMMNEKFNWLYINRSLVIRRTGNDSFLQHDGVLKRQQIEHKSFSIILDAHYLEKTGVRRVFFSKMVSRLPRAFANLKSQDLDIKLQSKLLNLYYQEYKSHLFFWIRVVPLFFIPNTMFKVVKKIYFCNLKYRHRVSKNTFEAY
jgi:glycosyltransferase involved in cell wall biosynthesis